MVCRQLGRAEGQLPRWMHRGPSQSRLIIMRRQLWKVEEGTVEVPLDKVWDASAPQQRGGGLIQEGCGQWRRAAWWEVRRGGCWHG